MSHKAEMFSTLYRASLRVFFSNPEHPCDVQVGKGTCGLEHCFSPPPLTLRSLHHFSPHSPPSYSLSITLAASGGRECGWRWEGEAGQRQESPHLSGHSLESPHDHQNFYAIGSNSVFSFLQYSLEEFLNFSLS